jgi:GNAT superfamily N-acetyltransferase
MSIKKLKAFYVNELVRDTGGAHVATVLEKCTDSIATKEARKLHDYESFVFWHVSGIFFCSYMGRTIGFLEHENQKAEFSFVLEKFKGHGLGYQLYETAINKLGTLRSSTSLSVGSSKLWAKLCKEHKGYVRLGDLRIPIVGYVERRGAMLPKVCNKSGDLVVLDSEDGSLSKDEQFECYNFVYEVHK